MAPQCKDARHVSRSAAQRRDQHRARSTWPHPVASSAVVIGRYICGWIEQQVKQRRQTERQTEEGARKQEGGASELQN